MLAVSDVRSIDALIADDPGALDDADVKGNLHAFKEARARLDAAEAATITEFDRRCLFAFDGAVNTASWLAHNTGVARAVAGARVALGRHLRRMPLMAQALAAGWITSSHVVTVGRRLSPRTQAAYDRDEALLVEHALALESNDFDVLATEWFRVNDEDGPSPEAPEDSELSVSPTFEGRAKIDGDLSAEVSSEVCAELEVIGDELWQEEQAAPEDDPIRKRTRKQRNAAALLEMARRSSSVRTSDPDSEDYNSRPRRPQFIVRADYDPVEDRYTNGQLEDGTVIGKTTLERWACDSSVARVLMKGGSEVIDLGTASYTPSAAQRRGLIARDGGCTVPGCKRKPRWCEAHHVNPYPNGPTNMSNLVLLCCRHHKQVHQGIIKLARDDPKGRWTVVRPDGSPLLERPPPRLVV